MFLVTLGVAVTAGAQEPKKPNIVVMMVDNLGVILAQDRIEEAIKLCRKAVELRPEEPKYAYTLAFCLQQGGRTEEAVRILRQIVVDHPTYVDGYLLLGDILEKQGRIEETIDLYRRAANQELLPERIRTQFAARIRILSSP